MNGYLAAMSLGNSRLLISFLYMLLLACGAYISLNLPESNLVIKLFIIDLALTILIFFQSAILKNASTYDLYWSVIPFAFLFYWIYELNVLEFNYRMLLCITLVSFWSWRLSLNWFRGWKGMDHEDWRYTNLRNKTTFFYPIVNFLGIHLMPTLLVFVASLPMESIFLSKHPLNYLDGVGAFIMLIGIVFELLADNQMHQFKKDKQNKGLLIESGIWRYSRHPNYLGEILFWWGLYILSISAGANQLLIIGPLLMTLLFVGISIPMMEKRLAVKYEGYQKYKQKTSMIIPFKF